MPTDLPAIYTRFKTHLKAAGSISLALACVCSLALQPAVAKTAKKLPQQNFLPPVATINDKLTAPVNAIREADPLEPVNLSAITSPALKVSAPVIKLDNDLGIRNQDKDYQALVDLEKEMHEEALRKLWEATVENNPVIRFSLEKISAPVDLQQSHSSKFLKTTLSTLISGAAMSSALLPGGGSYRTMGAMAGGDALQNLVNGRTTPQEEMLTPTEQIQLAGLVDELKAKLIHTYYDYRNTLQSLVQAHQLTQDNSDLYSKTLDGNNDLATMAAGTSYYKALLNESTLKQQAKMYRLQLERLAGKDAVSDIQLAVSPDALEKLTSHVDDSAISPDENLMNDDE